jgi:hypothetical protein
MQRITFLRAMHANGKAARLDPAQRAEWAAHQQRVATYAVVKAPAAPPLAAPTPPPVTALTPQAPRATAPAVPQASHALDGIARRTNLLTSLLGRPASIAPSDKPLV